MVHLCFRCSLFTHTLVTAAARTNLGYSVLPRTLGYRTTSVRLSHGRPCRPDFVHILWEKTFCRDCNKLVCLYHRSLGVNDTLAFSVHLDWTFRGSSATSDHHDREATWRSTSRSKGVRAVQRDGSSGVIWPVCSFLAWVLFPLTVQSPPRPAEDWLGQMELTGLSLLPEWGGGRGEISCSVRQIVDPLSLKEPSLLLFFYIFIIENMW